jgi:flagella basal body P-ring formation protein FlgA
MTALVRCAASLAVGALLCGPAAAATLRPYTTLDRPVVRLSDLFEGADDRALGPSPAPGARITVEAPQLAAIARMFAVDWRPAGPGDRAVLDRPGRSLLREDVLGGLRTTLEALGAPTDSEIDLPGFTTAPLPTEAPPTIAFQGAEFDPATGRFTTMMLATAEGVPPIQMRLSGRVQEMVALPVPRRAMQPGEVVAAADLQWTRMRMGLARGDVVRQAAQAEGQALRRTVQPGQPLHLADLGRPVVVAKGAPLQLSLEGAGLHLTAQGVAAEPGGLGERIHVLNPYSRAIILAEVTGPGRARVTPADGQGPGQ